MAESVWMENGHFLWLVRIGGMMRSEVWCDPWRLTSVLEIVEFIEHFHWL